MQLSLIIPTHRRPEQLKCLLQSILKQTLARTEFEVIVVSNFKDSKAKKITEDFSKFLNVKFLVSDELGVNRARNLGVNNASGALLYFLDDDCELMENGLQDVIRAHRSYPHLAGIGGPYENSPRTGVLGRAYNYNSRFWQSQATHLVGGNSSYKSYVFDGRKKFNENIVFGGSETEFNQRLIHEKHELGYFENLPVFHIPQMSFLQFSKKAFLQGAGTSWNDSVSEQKPATVPSEYGLRIFLWFYNLFFWSGVKFSKKEKTQQFSLWALISSFGSALFGELNNKLQLRHHLGQCFHWFRDSVWRYHWILTKPYYWLVVNPYHWLRKYGWRTKDIYHWFRDSVWRYHWLYKKPYYWFVATPYHWLRLYAWKTLKIFHWFRERIWSHFWKLSKPFHWLKLHSWKIKDIYHWFRDKIWRYHWFYRKPYYWVKLYSWYMKYPYYLLKVLGWYGRSLFLNAYAQVWRLKEPIHWLRFNIWKVRLPFYWIHKNWWIIPHKISQMCWILSWPIRKTYYFANYQFQKRILKLKNLDQN